MRQLTRLLRYVKPYTLQLVVSVLSMAMVGLLDAFRVLLIGPIFDRVLNPASQNRQITLFTIPWSRQSVYLQQFVPPHFQNAWTVVAFALVGSTLLKGLFDYLGTYLVNYAGFGMITDMRNDFTTLSCVALRLLPPAFHGHAALHHHQRRRTGAVRHVTVLAEFLQQFFTFLFIAVVVICWAES